MTWLEQNIDAYRIVSEILGDLRAAIRQGLEAVYGETWYRDGLPDEVFERLVGAKEREKAIDWYEGQYQQIMDYAVFADLVEIIDHNAEHFPALRELAPNNALLQARFIELDVMRSKLGRARPISETELSFLGTFHLRFRKAINEMPVPEPNVAEPAAEPVDAEAPSPPVPPEPEVGEPDTTEEPVAVPEAETEVEEPAVEDDTDEAEPVTTPETPPPRRVEAQPAAEKVQAPETPDDDRPEPDGAPKGPPKRAVQSSSPPPEDEPDEAVSEPEPPPPDTEATDEDEALHEEAGESDEHEHVGPKRLASALENNDHRTVLRELYREVTAIAEGVWTSEVTPAPLVWEQVTASSWYEDNFSKLGLHALSVFYEVTGNVETMAREGASKKELQEFLKDTNFAKTLLALRDMFQSNNL